MIAVVLAIVTIGLAHVLVLLIGRVLIVEPCCVSRLMSCVKPVPSRNVSDVRMVTTWIMKLSVSPATTSTLGARGAR